MGEIDTRIIETNNKRQLIVGSQICLTNLVVKYITIFLVVQEGEYTCGMNLDTLHNYSHHQFLNKLAQIMLV